MGVQGRNALWNSDCQKSIRACTFGRYYSCPLCAVGCVCTNSMLLILGGGGKFSKNELGNQVPGSCKFCIKTMEYASLPVCLLLQASVSFLLSSSQQAQWVECEPPHLWDPLFWEERWLLQDVTGWEGSWPVALIAGFLLGISVTPPSSLLK